MLSSALIDPVAARGVKTFAVEVEQAGPRLEGLVAPALLRDPLRQFESHPLGTAIVGAYICHNLSLSIGDRTPIVSRTGTGASRSPEGLAQ